MTHAPWQFPTLFYFAVPSGPFFLPSGVLQRVAPSGSCFAWPWLLPPPTPRAESSLLRLSHQRGSFPPPLLTAAGRRQPSVIATNSRFAPESLLAAATPLQDSSRRSAGRTSRTVGLCWGTCAYIGVAIGRVCLIFAFGALLGPQRANPIASLVQDFGQLSYTFRDILQRSSSPRQVFTSMLVGMDQDCVVPKDEMEKLAPLLQPLLDDIHSMMAKFRLDRLKST
ncbi:hypothetical protein EJB05_54290, partial [Eragrostis curvula]